MFRNYLSWKDYGVRGMKKGKHEMARDPEYLKRLKGLKGAPVSNVNYAQAGLDNTFNRNAINKRKALENEAIRNGLTHKEANRLVKLNKRTKNILGMKKNVANNRAQRAKEMAAYNEEMGKYKKNQKLLNLGITSNVMSKPELPKSVAEHKAAEERRRAQKISNANQRAAKQAQYANVRNELSSKAERPAGYKQKSMLSRISSGLSKHKGKAALAGLGLAAIGGGLGYAKHRGAFDSNYNVLKLKRNDSMNTYQKIKFLKFRRHMDAMRIKRLSDGFLGGTLVFNKIVPKIKGLGDFNTPLGTLAFNSVKMDLSVISKFLRNGAYNKNDILRMIIKSEKDIDRFVLRANGRIKQINRMAEDVGINKQHEIQLYTEDIAKAKRVNGILARLEVAFS
jgi:hypothetical protein